MYDQFTPDSAPIVQKYGGTSVGSIERIRAIAKRVAEQKKQGWNRIAIVVSAMSGETNRLVELVSNTNPTASARNYDMAVSAGEQVSVSLMAAALEGEGVASRGYLAYQLGIRTDELHAKARIQSIDCEKLERSWAADEIPVIAGFQGTTKDLEITTLGRGGSDTSAVALAVALGACFCEINTDVDGVFTADPRFVAGARLNEKLDFEVALEMASLGSKVLHARCVELAAKYNMPIIVRNTFKANDHARTQIMKFNNQERLESPVVSGVTLERKVAKITLDHLPTDTGLIAEIFDLVAKAEINVDIIVHNKSESQGLMRLGFTSSLDDLEKAEKVLGEWITQKNTGVKLESETGLAKISAVGLGMQSHPGVASRCFQVLAAEGIDIHMISTSEIKISCVVDETKADQAATVLHRAFIEN